MMASLVPPPTDHETTVSKSSPAVEHWLLGATKLDKGKISVQWAKLPEDPDGPITNEWQVFKNPEIAWESVKGDTVQRITRETFYEAISRGFTLFTDYPPESSRPKSQRGRT